MDEAHTKSDLSEQLLMTAKEATQTKNSSLLTNFKDDNSNIPQQNKRNKLRIERNIYTFDELQEAYPDDFKAKTLSERLRNCCSCSKDKLCSVVLGFFPIVDVLRNYSWRTDVLMDIAAGLSCAFLQMPQGLALGMLAALPPVYGLYSTLFPVLLYVIFGTSRHISMGTNAVLSLLTATVVLRELDMAGLPTLNKNVTLLSPNPSTASIPSMELTVSSVETISPTLEDIGIHEIDQDSYKVGVAAALSFISGCILFGMGLLKLGFLTCYLSTSFVGGFTTAAAVHIASSQVSKLLNIKISAPSGAGKLVLLYIDIFKNIGNSNIADVIVSVISIAFLLLTTIFVNEKYKDKLKVPVPVDFLIVVLSTFISHFAELDRRFGLAVVQHIPTGIPAPSLPNTEVMARIGTDAFVVAILTFAMTISMAKLTAKLHNTTIDDDQELVAYGMSNFVGSFFSCIPSATAPPRTMILSNLGVKSTLNGICTAVFLVIVLLVAGQLFYSLPIAVLAAMIIIAMKNLLLQVTQLPNLWRVSKPDFFIWLLTFLVSVLGDMDLGLMVGVGFSIFSVVIFNQLVSGQSGVRSVHEDLILYTSSKQGFKQAKSIKIFKFPSQLFFANADKFKNEIYSKILDPSKITTTLSYDLEEKQVKGKETPTEVVTVVLDCAPMTYIDVAGVNTLKMISTKYKKVGVRFVLAGCPDYTRQVLQKSGYFENSSQERLYYDIYDAVQAESDIIENNTQLYKSSIA